jgi:hypothetical protein
MMKHATTRGSAAALLSGIVLAGVLLLPSVACAANAYGQVFAGEAACLECHGDRDGRWQVGTYLDTGHAGFVTDALSPTSTLLPLRTGPLWPSPAVGGIAAGLPDIWAEWGSSAAKDFITVCHNDVPHRLSTGATISPVAGPPDDLLILSGISFDVTKNAWTLGSAVTVRPYFQSCGGCHFLGVTRPTDTTYTLASGATVGHGTPTAYAGYGIQCENCHGTGSAAGSHWTSGVGIVRTKQTLKSQTCGQCHVTGTAKEKNYAGKTFSSANGVTPD